MEPLGFQWSWKQISIPSTAAAWFGIPNQIFVDDIAFGEEYPDPEADGIFLKDPTLKAFLEGGPAIAAMLKQQHGFETLHSRQVCLQIIEVFARGGITERKMREACGLQPRPVPWLKI